MKRVTGIGGIFFRTRDTGASRAWYAKHLGIEPADDYGAVFQWRAGDAPDATGHTIRAPFPEDSKYFGSPEQAFMINYRVQDLRALLATLREEGVQVDDTVEEGEYGLFGWIHDPDGNRIELWQPPENFDVGNAIPMG